MTTFSDDKVIIVIFVMPKGEIFRQRDFSDDCFCLFLRENAFF